MKQQLNYCFFGSSDFSVLVLKEINKVYPPTLVVTLPAQPQGRGLKLQPNPVYSAALEQKLSVIELTDWNQLGPAQFSFGLIAGFSKIIPVRTKLHESNYESTRIEINDTIFENGILNLHPSLLPYYRGANPIREVILNGDKQTGVTLILIDELVDHGPIISQETITLSGQETYTELLQTLGRASGRLFNRCLEPWFSGQIQLQPQNHSLATYTKKLSKEAGLLKVDENFDNWDRKIRALQPWPGTFIYIHDTRRIERRLTPTEKNDQNGKRLLKIFKVERLNEKELPKEIQAKKLGEFFAWRNNLGLKINDKFIIIQELQLEGKKRMSSKEFLNGYPLGSFQLATS